MIRMLVASALLVIGAGLIVISSIGLIRLPDVYNRMNAVAKSGSLGLICVLLAVLVLLPDPRTVLVGLVAIGLQLVSAPVGGYALARAAYRAGSPLADSTRYDELGGRVQRHADDRGPG
ncbi:monovalent cation/H(+) antiporter subunit G [Salinispora vitiensis]|uniref:monovalent cation/H(+) antiporter subunit G n=1 Tax=Salinispora vitiensis TaxID=999544 RepID=UPI00036B1A04|nr:monovalent cation/H(+) antiporter subunit G [Salinispora vitiensis]